MSDGQAHSTCGVESALKPQQPATVTVLVVEDEYALRSLVARYFRKRGYDVMEAADGAQGIRLLQTSLPSIALVDLLMPVMDGTEFVRQVRALNHRFPILLVSASPEAFEACETFACDGVVTKPFDIIELAAKVEEVLKRA